MPRSLCHENGRALRGKGSSGACSAHLSSRCAWLGAGLLHKVQLNHFVQSKQPQVSEITSYRSTIPIKLPDLWFSCILMKILYLCCQECHECYLGRNKKIWSFLSAAAQLDQNPCAVPRGVCSRVSLTQNDLICYGWWEPEELNPGSAVNWGQAEMIYDLRNVLTLYTIIQTVSVGLSKLWNQIGIGIFQKMSSSRGRRSRLVGRWGWTWKQSQVLFSSLDQLPSKPWFIVTHRRDGTGPPMPRKFHLSGIWQEEIKNLWNLQRKLGFVPVTGSLCSLSQLVLAS